MKKPIQIIHCPGEWTGLFTHLKPHLIALCDDGTIWIMPYDKQDKWYQVDGITEESKEDLCGK